HQVPCSAARENEDHRKILENWLRSYRPEELFTATGAPVEELRGLRPEGTQRMSANPHANGGLLLRDLQMPDFRDYAVAVEHPGTGQIEATRVLGQLLRDVVSANMQTFRVFSPDENNSNRLTAILEATDRSWTAQMLSEDDPLAHDGTVMVILSEHPCQGWLTGLLFSGRPGFSFCSEAVFDNA